VGDVHEIVPRKRMMVFTGTAHPALSDEIAEALGLELTPAKLNRFSSGEIYFRAEESVRGADAFVIQTHSQPINEAIMEQLVMIDALKRASAKRITAVVPYYGYSRQDKKSLSREPISAKLVADMLTAAGANRVVSVDLHSGQIQGFFNYPFDHLTALPLLSNFLTEEMKLPEDLVVVAPDAGRVKTAERLREDLHARNWPRYRAGRLQAAGRKAGRHNLGRRAPRRRQRLPLHDPGAGTAGAVFAAFAHRRGAGDELCFAQ